MPNAKLDVIVKYILYRRITKHFTNTSHSLIAMVELFDFNRQSVCLNVGNMSYIHGIIFMASFWNVYGGHFRFCWKLFVYFWLYPLDSCSIAILDSKKLWWHITIINVANIHSAFHPFEMFMAAIFDFVGSHFVYFWLCQLDSCSIVILYLKNLWLHIKIITVEIIHSELQSFQISLSAILDFGSQKLSSKTGQGFPPRSWF